MSESRRSLLERLRNNPQVYNNEELMSRGQRARSILESDVFTDAFMDAEADLMLEWRENQESSPVSRERAHAAVRGLDVLWNAMLRIANDGLHAEKRIEDAENEPL